jgi:Family of unknown function (DUF6476)
MRSLKILVIVMGLLIVTGLTVIFATLAKRMAGGGEPQAFDSTTLQLPKGCRVVEMAAAGARLALRLGDGPDCDAILFVDPATGRQLGRLQLLQQP